MDGLYTSSSCSGGSCRSNSGSGGGGILRIYPRSESKENEKRALLISLPGGHDGGRKDSWRVSGGKHPTLLLPPSVIILTLYGPVTLTPLPQCSSPSSPPHSGRNCNLFRQRLAALFRLFPTHSLVPEPCVRHMPFLLVLLSLYCKLYQTLVVF